MALQITVTNAGRQEIINAENTGTEQVTITAVAFGTGQYTPAKTQTALQSETKRVTTISGKAVAPDTIHVMALDEGSDAYNVGEFGLISDKGTLIAVYSQLSSAGWIIQKGAASTLLLATDIILESLGTTAITFGDISFINPPATTTVPGVVELATAAEVQTGTDNVRAVTPAGLKSLTANTERAGLVQLNNSLTSTSTSQALTAAQGKKLQDEKLDASRVQNSTSDTTPNALMMVAAFGIGGVGVLAPSDDLNLIDAGGLYLIHTNTLNKPNVASGSMCLHLRYNATNSEQMVFSRSADRVFFRRCSAGTWSEWHELWHSGNLSPVTTSRTIYTGNGLTGGGDLAANRTISLGSPSTLSGDTVNSVTEFSHTHAIAAASTTLRGVVELATATETQTGTDNERAVTPAGLKSLTANTERAGLVQLNNSLTSTSTSQALTAAQGKKLQDEKLDASRVQNSTTDTTANALMMVAAFGYGALANTNYPRPSYDTPDCPTGSYRVAGATGTPPPGAPSDFSISVFNRFNSNDIQQVASYNTSGGSRWFFRRVTNAAPNPWQEIITDANVASSNTDTTNGKLLTRGYYGLGGTPVALPASFDLNQLQQTGFFQTGSSPVNAWPTASGNAGDLLLQIDRSATAIQLGFNRTSDQLWFRRRGEQWREIFHTGNLTPVENSRTVSAGNGLTGGGDLSANRSISLGTPSTLSGNTSNAATSGSHTHALAAATDALSGVVELATAAEVQTGTDNVRAVTPASLVAGLLGLGNMTSSGHLVIPFRDASGTRRNFVIQWLTVGPLSTQMSPVDIVWPTSFPTVCLGALATDTGSASNIMKAWKVVEDTIGLNGSKVMFNNLSGTGQGYARVFAWGY